MSRAGMGWLVMKLRSKYPKRRLLLGAIDLTIVVIHKLPQFTGIRAAGGFIRPLQLHWRLLEPVEQLRPIGMPLHIILVISLVAHCEKPYEADYKLSHRLRQINNMDWTDLLHTICDSNHKPLIDLCKYPEVPLL
jgi:hypothetical protein